MTAVYREVKILQEDLKDNDAYNGPITGRFDLATFNGIRTLINSGKLGPPIELPDPSEDAYGSVVAAVADELNYMPSAVNAVRSAYSEWARGAQSMYVTPAVLSDFGGQDPAVTGAVMTLQTILSRKGWLSNRPQEPLYKGPVDGNYTTAVENGFRQFAAIARVDMAGLLQGTPEFPRDGLTGPVLRAISSARNAAGFGTPRSDVKTQTEAKMQSSRDKPVCRPGFTPVLDKTTGKYLCVKGSGTDPKDPKRCPSGTRPSDQKGQCPKGYVAIKDGSGCCSPLTDSKTGNAVEQAKKIAEAARIAAENARNAAKKAEEAALKAAKDKDAKSNAAAVQAAKEAEAKAFAAQATIDAANAAAEAARLRAAEEAATARAVLDSATQASIDQANTFHAIHAEKWSFRASRSENG